MIESHSHASRGSNTRFVICILIFCIIILMLHFWKLGLVPLGFYVDEMSIGYNAYCIVKTGADEYGSKYPLFFRCFDNYQDPVMVYFLTPMIKTFGLNQTVVRFPSAFFHILASIAFGFLVHEYCRNKWFALLGGVLFSVIPWSFTLSRTICSGYTPMLLGINMGWFFLIIALRKHSLFYAVGAGIVWGFTMYTHNTARPMTGLLLIAFGLAFNRLLFARWKVWMMFLATYIGALIPMIISIMNSSKPLTTRFQEIGILHDHPPINEFIGRFSSRYIEYFNPRFLFFLGDNNLRNHTGIGGVLFIALIPLLLTGFYVMFRFARKQPYYRFLILGLLIYPAAAALTMERMHSTRSLNGVSFWLLAAMIGAHFLWLKKGIWRILVFCTCLLTALESINYLSDYFGHYQIRSQNYFRTGLTEAVRYCFRYLDNKETLYVSPNISKPFGHTIFSDLKPYIYIYFLFYGKIEPKHYQLNGLPSDIVCLYDGTISNSGLLLWCEDILLKKTGQIDMPYPAGRPNGSLQTQLVTEFPFNQRFIYKIYRISCIRKKHR